MSFSLIKLIRSLSKSEKRDFQFATHKQQGDKQYSYLFTIIDKSKHNELSKFKTEFLLTYPSSSFEATATYLTQSITEVIIRSEKKRNPLFQLHYGLLQLHVLKERNVEDLWIRELMKLKNIASTINYPVIDAILSREELTYLSANSFRNITEKELIEKQQSGREALLTMRNTYEHYTLYELIKLRLTREGKTVSEKKLKKLDDLIFQEMSIINARVKHNAESRKVHLLFQSFFLTNIGDYQSALKSFQEICRLFEQNHALWIHSPTEYITVLDGILDSLRAIGNYGAMDTYIQKLEEFDNDGFPENICRIARNTSHLYRIIILVADEHWTNAYEFIEQRKGELHGFYGAVNDEKVCELFFYSAVIYFQCSKIKEAQRAINSVLNINETGHNSMIVRAGYLLNLIFYYRNGDFEYLEYATRNFRRMFYGKEKMLKTEKLILKTFKEKPRTMHRYNREQQINELAPLIICIRQDHYEMQLLKYFDFCSWIQKEYSSR